MPSDSINNYIASFQTCVFISESLKYSLRHCVLYIQSFMGYFRVYMQFYCCGSENYTDYQRSFWFQEQLDTSQKVGKDR